MQTLDAKVGGVASAVLALSRGMAGRGHTVEIVTLDERNAALEAAPEVRVHALGHGLTSYRYSAAFSRWLGEHAGEFDRVIGAIRQVLDHA